MKLLVVDDHPIVRDGLAALLGHLERDALVLQAGDAQKALALVAAHADIDVVILDIAMPGMNGLRALAEFARARPELPVIVISASEDARDVREALAKGAPAMFRSRRARTRFSPRSGWSCTVKSTCRR